MYLAIAVLVGKTAFLYSKSFEQVVLLYRHRVTELAIGLIKIKAMIYFIYEFNLSNAILP